MYTYRKWPKGPGAKVNYSERTQEKSKFGRTKFRAKGPGLKKKNVDLVDLTLTIWKLIVQPMKRP